MAAILCMIATLITVGTKLILVYAHVMSNGRWFPFMRHILGDIRIPCEGEFDFLTGRVEHLGEKMVESLRKFYEGYGIVIAIGKTKLDADFNISSNGEDGFTVYFEKMKKGVSVKRVPKIFEGKRVKCSLTGKIFAC